MTVPVELQGADARTALELAGQLAEATSADGLRDALFALPAAIGADGLLDARIERPRDGPLRIAAAVNDPVLYQPIVVEVVTRWWRRHPVVSRHVLRRTPEPIMVSDYLTASQWRGNVVFNEGYRPLGITHDLSIQFGWAPGRTACAALHRAGPAFTERDRAMLVALAPHLRAAHARAETYATLTARVELVCAGRRADGEEVVLLGGHDSMLLAAPRALQLLQSWFGAPESAGRLPVALADWYVAARRAPGPTRLVRARPGRRLRVTLITGPEEDVLLLREERDQPASALALAAALPISRREADVLERVIGGRTNAEIARELTLSPRTVGHHVERILAKLGAPNRAAATATALSALAG